MLPPRSRTSQVHFIWISFPPIELRGITVASDLGSGTPARGDRHRVVRTPECIERLARVDGVDPERNELTSSAMALTARAMVLTASAMNLDRARHGVDPSAMAWDHAR
jgi:hypothetical protein